jgi:transcriptional regulator with XRE-family HTH domain
LPYSANLPVSPRIALSATVEVRMKRTSQWRAPGRVPNRLWRYRRRMGFSQEQVAELAGYLAPSDISRFERGERLPSLIMALKLEIIYRAPVGFLYQDLYLRLRDAIREKEERRSARECRRSAS